MVINDGVRGRHFILKGIDTSTLAPLPHVEPATTLCSLWLCLATLCGLLILAPLLCETVLTSVHL